MDSFVWIHHIFQSWKGVVDFLFYSQHLQNWIQNGIHFDWAIPLLNQ